MTGEEGVRGLVRCFDADGNEIKVVRSTWGPSSGFDVVKENGEWVTRHWAKDAAGNLTHESAERGWPKIPGTDEELEPE